MEAPLVVMQRWAEFFWIKVLMLMPSPVPSSRDTALTIAADKGHYKFCELSLAGMMLPYFICDMGLLMITILCANCVI